MTAEALVDRLADIFPDFKRYWDDANNDFRGNDGSFTLHGVFSHFTHFFREKSASLPAQHVAELGAFISECMAPADDNALNNAAATCFVENIAGEPCQRLLSPHLTGAARRYWLAWGVADAEPGAAADGGGE